MKASKEQLFVKVSQALMSVSTVLSEAGRQMGSVQSEEPELCLLDKFNKLLDNIPEGILIHTVTTVCLYRNYFVDIDYWKAPIIFATMKLLFFNVHQ